MDSEVSRMEWPLAIVVEAQQDDDGLVRRVKVRWSTSSLDKDGTLVKKPSVLERPVQRIVVLVESDTGSL